MQLRKSNKREQDLIAELRVMYHYLFVGMQRRNERSTMLFRRKGKKMQLTPAVVMRLVVPTGSALGRQIAAAYKRDDKKIAKAKAAKEARRATSHASHAKLTTKAEIRAWRSR